MKGLSRARIGVLSAAVGVLLVGLSVTGQSANAATNSLTNWTKQGAPGAGTWTVANDGNSVTQSINGAPTFFVSNFLKESATFTVDITPATSSDNDYVGVVLGYTAPMNDATCASANCSNSYILLDWKQEAELGQEAGFHLTRVNGSFDVRDPNAQLPCFWDHTDSATCDQLATPSTGNTQGWAEGAKNTLKITYGPGNIKVENVGALATTTIFDVTGTFPTGRVGFYNYSQANVTYAINDLADPTAPTTTTTSTSTTSTTVVTTSTTRGPITTLATRIARTGPTDKAGIELSLGAAFIALGAVLMAARGKRPEGRYYVSR